MRSYPAVALFSASLFFLTACAHAPAAAPTGTPLDFTVASYPAKAPFELKSERGHVVMLDVWATWCEPCRQSLPLYQAMAKKYAAQGFRLYAMNVDGDSAVPTEIPKFIVETGLAVPILLDTDAALAQSTLKVSVMPTTILLDRSGRVRFMHEGFEEKTLAEVEKQVQALLGENDAEKAEVFAPGEGRAGAGFVNATQRATLSKRCMQFQEDGDELVLENHLIDSREGSSGARGARGGGCGCN